MIKALKNDFDYFSKYSHFVDEYQAGLTFGKNFELFGQNFIINLSNKLTIFERLFGEEVAKEFITNQMAAGKENYDEAQFIRALSEVHVLNYLASYTSKIKNLSYEPKLIEGKSTNPEAVLCLEDGTEIAVEVKTPGFKNQKNLNKSDELYIRPNVILKKTSLDKFKTLVESQNVNFVYPNILKLRDFIISAASKFPPVTENRMNLLFINWTYNDFKTSGLNEPISLLLNSYSGLLHSKLARTEVKIPIDYLNRISAIIFYKDNFHSFIASDFRYHFAYNSIFAIPVNTNDEQMRKFKILTNIRNLLDSVFTIFHIDRSNTLKSDLVRDTLLYSVLLNSLKCDFKNGITTA
ncbi:hypothetical protein [Desulfobacter sp. UBA2225]|uniref:hypothetical protein n=1 Tax=Desulfobacter sp. UBA2225 TaxID=1961413 RepID=UPI00257A699D|nr:hypothetical protein [Desulfobacter sp. UBA2225]